MGNKPNQTHQKFSEWMPIACIGIKQGLLLVKLSEMSSCVIKVWHLGWSESQQIVMGSEEEYLNGVTVLLISPVTVSTSGRRYTQTSASKVGQRGGRKMC